MLKEPWHFEQPFSLPLCGKSRDILRKGSQSFTCPCLLGLSHQLLEYLHCQYSLEQGRKEKEVIVTSFFCCACWS